MCGVVYLMLRVVCCGYACICFCVGLVVCLFVCLCVRACYVFVCVCVVSVFCVFVLLVVSLFARSLDWLVGLSFVHSFIRLCVHLLVCLIAELFVYACVVCLMV